MPEERIHIPKWGLFPSLVAEVSNVIERMEMEESEPFHSFYVKYGVSWMLGQFKNDRENNKEHKTWDLIPAEQYRTLLERFMQEPQLARIPDNVVTEWIMIIFKNLCQAVSITKLYGKNGKFPTIEVKEAFSDAPDGDTLTNGLEFLDSIGFYRWSNIGERKSSSDTGLGKLFDILITYNENMTPEEKLIMVNRCLDITHKRGPMSWWFIEGGKETCDRISRK